MVDADYCGLRDRLLCHLLLFGPGYLRNCSSLCCWQGTFKESHQPCSPPSCLSKGNLKNAISFLMALQNVLTGDGLCFNDVLELFDSILAFLSVIWVYIQWLITCQEFHYGQQISFNRQQRPNSHCLTSLLRTMLDDSRHTRWDLPPSLCSVWAISKWMGCRFPCELCCVGACFRPG